MSVNDASRIIVDDSKVTLLIVATLFMITMTTFYYRHDDRNMFIVQATGLSNVFD